MIGAVGLNIPLVFATVFAPGSFLIGAVGWISERFWTRSIPASASRRAPSGSDNAGGRLVRRSVERGPCPAVVRVDVMSDLAFMYPADGTAPALGTSNPA